MVKKTFYPKIEDISRKWVLVDAKGKNLGRLSTVISKLIIGKHKPEYTPGVDTGDFVVVNNAEQIVVTGKKMDDKYYYRVSGYQSGLKKINLRDQLEKRPEYVIEHAVKGMLPHTRLGRELNKKLKVYAGSEHPHQAQKPVPVEEIYPNLT
ncbi:MAG: 50S ribosomal protein L13 [Anaerolineales bacterium]|nr:50S ribosomal protein L13 [Anaerolineales bacterium]